MLVRMPIDPLVIILFVSCFPDFNQRTSLLFSNNVASQIGHLFEA